MLFGGQIGPKTFQYLKSDDTAKYSALVLITGAGNRLSEQEKGLQCSLVLCCISVHLVPSSDAHSSTGSSPN